MCRREIIPRKIEDNPIFWFAEMLLGLDRGDFRLASVAQDELTRLGWRVDRKPRRKSPQSLLKAAAKDGAA